MRIYVYMYKNIHKNTGTNTSSRIFTKIVNPNKKYIFFLRTKVPHPKSTGEMDGMNA